MKLLLVSLLQENSFVKEQIEIDDQLMKKITTDNVAFRTLYEGAYKAVYGFAYTIVKNPQDAQDVVQDTFISVYKSAHKYKPQGKPMSWILTIAKNCSLMKIKARKKYVYVDDVNGMENMFQVQPDTSYSDKFILQNALSKLTQEEREIVVLHALSNLKHREISELLNIKLSTVLSKYNRALKKLREIIEEECYE